MSTVNDVVDLGLEATVVLSFSRVGYEVRHRLGSWADPATGSMLGQVAVVTGATSGIGLALATRFAELGATVVVVGRDPARLQSAADRITRATGSDTVITAGCDLTRLDDVRALDRADPTRPRPPRRAGPQRRRARARVRAHRRRPRVDRADPCRRAVPAHGRLDRPARGDAGRPRPDRLVGRDVHRRAGRPRPRSRRLRRRPGLRPGQAGAGGAQRAVGAAPPRRRQLPGDAPRLGGHARAAGLVASLRQGHGPRAAHDRTRASTRSCGWRRPPSTPTAGSGSTAADAGRASCPGRRPPPRRPIASGTGPSCSPTRRRPCTSPRVEPSREGSR